MKEFSRTIGLIIFLICFLSGRAYSSTNKTQTYVSRSGYSALLFGEVSNDSVKAARTDSIKLKDPKMAVFYAIIPGLVIHGSGHFYAGKPKTGLILLGTEAVGFVFFMMGVAAEFRENGADGGGSFQVITGFTLFLGSWIYDMIGAPLTVQIQNQKLLGK